jgi:hypothetical protein
MKIRKQVYDFKPRDLNEYPCWEFALDEEGQAGQDEATVRPIMQGGPVDPANGMCRNGDVREIVTFFFRSYA